MRRQPAGVASALALSVAGWQADVAKLADAADLGSAGVTRVGSSPIIRTSLLPSSARPSGFQRCRKPLSRVCGYAYCGCRFWAFGHQLQGTAIGRQILEVRHRASARDSIAKRHERLLAAIAKLPPAWLGDLSRVTAAPEVQAGDFGAFVKLGPALGKGLRGEVSYPLRDKDYLRDIARHDDRLVIEFDSGQVDFVELTTIVFPALVEAFEAYRAAVKDDAQCLVDWPRIAAQAKESGRDVDGRDSIFRIHAVNYFDRDLCRRALGLAPADLLQKLGGVFDRAELFHDGVLLVCSKAAPEADELRLIEEAFRPAPTQPTMPDRAVGQ